MIVYRENLEKLSNYLLKIAASKGQEESFSMAEFISSEGSLIGPLDVDRYYNALNGHCGAAACAIGHGPAAGIRPKSEDYTWMIYSENSLIPRYADEEQRIAWVWCFGSSWAFFDDTALGAALRIKYYLAHGRPPEWFGPGMVYEAIERSSSPIRDTEEYHWYMRDIYAN